VPEQGEKLIEQERERVLKEAFSRNRFVEHVCARLHVSADQVANAMLQSPSYKEFLARLGAGGEDRPSWQAGLLARGERHGSSQLAGASQ